MERLPGFRSEKREKKGAKKGGGTRIAVPEKTPVKEIGWGFSVGEGNIFFDGGKRQICLGEGNSGVDVQTIGGTPEDDGRNRGRIHKLAGIIPGRGERFIRKGG